MELEVSRAVFFYIRYLEKKEDNQWFLASLQAEGKEFHKKYEDYINKKNATLKETSIKDTLLQKFNIKEEFIAPVPLINSGKKKKRIAINGNI